MARGKAARSSPVLQVEYVLPARLTPAPYNPRQLSAEERERLKRGILEFGMVDPIIARREDGLVLGGHQRLKVLVEDLGYEAVPVVFLEGLSDERAKALNVLLNNPKAQGSWDTDALAQLLSDLVASDVDETLTGFDLGEIQELLGAGDEDGREPAGEEPDKVNVSQPGEVWLLGRHRLMVGDATNHGHVAQLMDGERADLVNTDPPYGAAYSGTGEGAKTFRARGFTQIAGDALRGDELLAMLAAAFKNGAAFAEPHAAFYFWHSSATRREFERAMDAAALEERQYIIWAKDQFAVGGMDYHQHHEPCYYAQKAGERAQFFGGRKGSTVWRFLVSRTGGERSLTIANGVRISDAAGAELFIQTKAPKGKKARLIRLDEGEGLILTSSSEGTDLWEVRLDNDKYQHPTQKPVALAIRAIANSSLPGQVVLDLFGGGGFTLLGAEVAGRAARVMELVPQYADVIIKRWQRLTGGEAMRDGDFRPWNELAAELGVPFKAGDPISYQVPKNPDDERQAA